MFCAIVWVRTRQPASAYLAPAIHFPEGGRQMANVIKVALIGAGRSGTPLLKQLMKYTYIKIVGVADRKEKAAGIKMAAKKKIFTTTDAMKLMKKSKNVDILI